MSSGKVPDLIILPSDIAVMAAIAKKTGNGQQQRPVEFRGLSTHYVTGETIRVSFRYPTSFQPHSDDKVKLYVHHMCNVRRRTGRERSISCALVGDTSKHRLCDGGVYKTGSVAITTASVNETGRSYILLYGSSRLHRAVGKSAPFIICPQKEFPSIQIRSIEDGVYVEKLRAHSPIGEGTASSLYTSTAAEDTVLTSSLSEGWEELRESDGWSDVGEQLKSSLLISSDSGEESSAEKSYVEPQTGSMQPVAKPGKMKQQSEDWSITDYHCPLEASILPNTESAEVRKTEAEDRNTVMLKNANRELRTKVRVLHDKLHSVSEERDSLLALVDDMSGRVSQLKDSRSELKRKNKKLTEENLALKTKCKQLQRESVVLTEHCEKQTVQLIQCERNMKAICSEKQQLQRQLRHATRKSKCHQKSANNMQQSVINGGHNDVQRPVVDVHVRDQQKERDQTTLDTNGIGTRVHKPAKWVVCMYCCTKVYYVLSSWSCVMYSGTSDDVAIPHPQGDGPGNVVSGEGLSLSEDHIQSLIVRLKGGQQSFQCPVCMRVLHSHETEYSAQLHVEQCLLDT